MYGLVRQTFPPTSTNDCLSCNLTGDAHEKNLVVAGSTVLTVYGLREPRRTSVTERRKKKLEVLFQHNLNGILHGVQSVRMESNSRDSLLLSFEDAKFSVVEYDPDAHCLKTVKLVDFREEVDKEVLSIQAKSIIRVDPIQRCGVMLIFGSHLAVFPFRRELSDDQDLTRCGFDEMPHYVIDLKSISDRIANVIDVQFLHGYHEPTLLILFESLRTWPGRVAVRQDTCALIAISMNITQKVHPVIWSLNNLPFDCFKALAVPKPIGGVIIMAVNSLLYLNQSIPPCGVSLNSITEQSTMFQLKPQPGVRLTLDCACAAFLSNDRMVISLKSGEIYVVTLVADSMRTVRSFNFDKAAASVITTCICALDTDYLFLGSHLGNSVLLRYTQKSQDESLPKADAEAEDNSPSSKRRKTESFSEQTGNRPSLVDDLDDLELEVYGSDTHSGTELASYSFEVADSLPNTAPFAKAVVGEPALLSEEFLSDGYLDLEIVGCSGYGKNGALSVLQRSVRPQVVTAFELPGCVDMWTVKSSMPAEESDDAELAEASNQHAFLILSRADSSMVLQTGQEIMELDHCGFNTQSATICVGNLAGSKYILQVCPTGIYLLEGADQLEYLPLDEESTAVGCSIVDPFAVILLSDGSLCLLTLREEAGGGFAEDVEIDDMPSVRLHVSKPNLVKGPPIVACCLYEDVSGLFALESDVVVKEERAPSPLPQQPAPPTVVAVDDEDELLYGDSAPEALIPGMAKPSQSSSVPLESSSPSSPSMAPPKVAGTEPTYWCVTCRETGDLEVYQLPEFKQVLKVDKFVRGNHVLEDSESDEFRGSDEHITLHEILLIGMGMEKGRPHLMARVDQDLLIYEAFPCRKTIPLGRLKIRFRKIDNQVLQREKSSGPQERSLQTASKLRVFGNVSGYSGVFVCGAFPHWIFMTHRGALRFHPMSIDGPIVSFAPFNNVNCPDGFLYFNHAEDLRICVLPTHLSYDNAWLLRKVPLRASPRFISYHPESMTYAVVTSKEVDNRAEPRLNNDDIEEVEYVDRDDRFVFPTMEKFSLQLYSSLNWEAVPNAQFELDDWEHATALKTLRLHSEETISGRKGFLVVATTSVFGEEVTSRGRIVIFDVIEVVPEPGKPLTKHKLKELCSKEQRGPVTAVEQVDGYLLTSIGQKIYVWKFKGNNDIIGLAFIDTQLYIHTTVTLKNFVLIADVTKSLSLLRYQEEHKTLALVSKDLRELEIYTAEYVVDGKQLAFLVSDSDRNLILYHYNPEAVESVGGQRLLPRADFHLGSRVNAMFRTPVGPAKSGAEKKGKHITWFATLDGGLGYFIPMPEKTYRRLLMLQNKLVTGIPHFAGLNPKAFRLPYSQQKSLSNPCKNVLDGNLLWRYVSLSYKERNDFARQIGTTVNQILQDLMDVDKGTALF